MSPATTRTRTVKRTTGLNWRSVSSKAARYFLPSIRTWDSTPASCVIAFYRDLRDRLWGVYGFVDFQPAAELGIGYSMGLNQAPMAVMIENNRTGVVWKAFMSNPEIRTMIGNVGPGQSSAPSPIHREAAAQ